MTLCKTSQNSTLQVIIKSEVFSQSDPIRPLDLKSFHHLTSTVVYVIRTPVSRGREAAGWAEQKCSSLEYLLIIDSIPEMRPGYDFK